MRFNKHCGVRLLAAFSFVVSSFTLSILLGSCNKKDYHAVSGMVWHTTYHITWEGPLSLADSILPVLNHVGASLDYFNPNSLLSKVNESDSVEVDNHFTAVYIMANSIHRLSGGAFDPTLSPLIEAWGFGKAGKASADTLRLDSLLGVTGLGKTRLQNGILIKENPAIQFNFSAIAKGYGVDCVANMLKRNGVVNFLVEIGGELRTSGSAPHGGDWRISIDRPVMQDGVCHDSASVIEIRDCGVATSGNYRNYRKSGGEAYGHTISPRTGRPIKTSVLSATVVAPTAMEADALATAFMALPADSAYSLAVETGYAVLLIESDTVRATPAFGKLSVK